jgi:hypothetical protein
MPKYPKLRHGPLSESAGMIYKGFQLTAVEQPDGRWMVEVVPTCGGGKPFFTQIYRERAGAMASARRMLDNGVRTP